MDIKPRPNHDRYIAARRNMTPEQRLTKALGLSKMTKDLFLVGLHRRFSAKSESEIMEIYLDRIAKCHNRNY
jgi:hypothetical protein